ncbi:hypothetical protein CERZMDRAFT_34526 [Cercospora zeae-maydis SCOH1-5]|uniref:2-methylcitrate dehydratase n=1 Tax=Cercospora zeae-maydis SCOH1-5 TaxID=717836 RepID=A0A6A6FRC4_9PEZI|nr:hypothetical protein CERZMDRAFT_34526 [Cercospora zeae-maydis SCOH1-5]
MSSDAYDQVIIDIQEYVCHYEITSPKAWRNARTALLDAIGCAIETVATSTECKSMLGPVVPGSSIPCGFRLPGTSFILDPVKGSFDMATAIRYLDHNDAIAGADWGHPSDNLGAILAVADWIYQSEQAGVYTHRGPALTIKTVLIALIKAYEIQGCMLLRNAFNQYGLDHVILVKLASTAVTAWLMGLSIPQIRAAISQVWMDGHALRVYRQKGNTIPRKGWAAGDACMKATHLALLTRAGQPGSPTPLTMPRWGFYANSFGGKTFDLPKKYGSWVVENIIFKIAPIEGHGLSSVQAAMEHLKAFRPDTGSVEDIERIMVRTNAATDLIINKTGPLHNAADRDHCLQFLIALTFLKGAYPEAADFLDSSVWSHNPDIDRLRDKVEVIVDDQLTAAYMDLDVKSLATGMTLQMKDGALTDEILVHFPIGHGKNPATAQAVHAKFEANMRHMFTMEEIQEIRGMVESTSSEVLPISRLMDRLVRPKVQGCPRL